MTKNKNEKSIKISIINEVDTEIKVNQLSLIEVLGLLRLYEQRISLQMLSDHVIKQKEAMIYFFTLKIILISLAVNYRFKNRIQIAKYLTGIGCKRVASKLFSTIRKIVLQACYCFRFNYYHSLHANT